MLAAIFAYSEPVTQIFNIGIKYGAIQGKVYLEYFSFHFGIDELMRLMMRIPKSKAASILRIFLSDGFISNFDEDITRMMKRLPTMPKTPKTGYNMP